MKIKTLFFLAFTLVYVSSCTVEEVDPDLASQIVGSYQMLTYVTHAGASTPSANDKIVINKIDDVHADVLIDYSSSSSNDVELSNVSIVKSGNKYLLDRSFDNAEASGEVIGDSLTLNVGIR